MSLCNDLLNDDTVKCVYLAAVLVLVLVIAMHVMKLGWFYDEQFANISLDPEKKWETSVPQAVETPFGAGWANNPRPYNSGANVRFSEFTSTSQVPYSTGYVVRT